MNEYTKNKLRADAIKNGLGHYKIYDRQPYSTEQIDLLVEQYLKSPPYSDLFDKNKIHKSYSIWRNSIIRKLDWDSCNSFFYKLEANKHFCEFCKNELFISDYRYNRNPRFRRFCKVCNDNQNFKRYKHSEESIKKFSISKSKWAKSDDGIKFYKKLGEHNRNHLKKYFKTDKGIEQIKLSAIKQSKLLKEKIKNGLFTPNITNSWTHWDSNIILNGKKIKFRSSWEACFYVCHQDLLYEYLRIPYVDENGINRTYISDFYDQKNNILYEIKPRSFFKRDKKINSIIEYCKNNGIKFIWINENNILKYIDKTKFSKYNLNQYEKMISGIMGNLK